MGTGNHRLPDKKDVARGLLLRGSVFVHLDPRVDGVVVPSYLRKQPQLVLQVGLDMPIPIPDLRVDDDGVFGTLSFNRSPFTVLVPWDAVYAVADDEGRAMVWPASLPDELRAEVEREMGLRPPQKGLRVVDGGVEDDADTDADGPSEQERRSSAALESVPPPPPEDDDPDDESGEGEGGPGGGRKLPPYLRVVK
ncbi:MAG TPA: ClpXP protease specificity-enhancing factor SspB [Polyangiaceae bacterium LLY-WYZ-15_(1-7)]|nr:hypothetical protein [Myxococcales bacterium]MAT26121.1 hypothetical protein [Sandaracinus sp.]HJL05805.1 ClpXP protease specificity-enhancing factor SspB [Polyangiaceae bacterium LLY-WYZ-15_(1-7)]MBJ73720.1 hypothetical protein [Sandaracinus sp.]HJL13915.1 ClpXP protease specificity-enhancing factor SspB [Polyangiaceae bacterium LLY-WYZ-15_(1-7)]